MSEEPRTMEVMKPTDEHSVFMPVMSLQVALDRRTAIVEFTRRIMVADLDFGVIPGTNKPTLLKPGAEKLCCFFGLEPEFTVTETMQDWTGREHDGEMFFYVAYKCRLLKHGQVLGVGEGSCNSWESKYRYRWVREEDVPRRFELDEIPERPGTVTEFAFAVDKAETGGKYGKPAEYWAKWQEAIKSGDARSIMRKTSKGREMEAWEMGGTLYRVPNPDIADVVNTIQKMAQKRALVAATLIATSASEFYTQDVEDLPMGEGIDTGGHAPGTQAAADYVGSQKLKTNGDVPAGLKVFFDGIDKDVAKSAQAFASLSDALYKKGGIRGIKEYDRIEGAFHAKYPKGTGDKAVLKATLRELWDALQALPEEKAPEGEDLFGQQETARHG